MENARFVAGTDKIVLLENITRLLADGCPSPDDFYDDMNAIMRCSSPNGITYIDELAERISNGDTAGV